MAVRTKSLVFAQITPTDPTEFYPYTVPGGCTTIVKEIVACAVGPTPFPTVNIGYSLAPDSGALHIPLVEQFTLSSTIDNIALEYDVLPPGASIYCSGFDDGAGYIAFAVMASGSELDGVA